jgi:hypothetical protein
MVVAIGSSLAESTLSLGKMWVDYNLLFHRMALQARPMHERQQYVAEWNI